jgi:hypothetical protein
MAIARREKLLVDSNAIKYYATTREIVSQYGPTEVSAVLVID